MGTPAIAQLRAASEAASSGRGSVTFAVSLRRATRQFPSKEALTLPALTKTEPPDRNGSVRVQRTSALAALRCLLGS
jgi:hypothetical protein